MLKTAFVTGGAGFIGSALVRLLIRESQCRVVNLDKLTYAGNLDSLKEVDSDPRYAFEQVDICDADAIAPLFNKYRPDGVFHLAAESHVDRSIDSAAAFIQTNVVGTYTLLEVARRFWSGLEEPAKQRFRFLHVSTDEVYGSLGETGAFTEETPYHPNSPYSASKAGSDHLAMAWQHTYRLPILLSNCSNNYGPRQFPEKLIPVIVLKALNRQPIPVYGTGSNVRDWLFVEDHARALRLVMEQGRAGESYNIGGNSERRNFEVVRTVCAAMDELLPDPPSGGFASLISFVKDRPGHDFRYAIDASKIRRELGWQPTESFESGIRKTVQWYLQNEAWWKRILSGEYRLERLGLMEH